MNSLSRWKNELVRSTEARKRKNAVRGRLACGEVGLRLCSAWIGLIGMKRRRTIRRKDRAILVGGSFCSVSGILGLFGDGLGPQMAWLAWSDLRGCLARQWSFSCS